MEAHVPNAFEVLGHCKEGQEAVHDILMKAQELFNALKNTNASLVNIPDDEKKKTKIRDTLHLVQHLFSELRRHYNVVKDTCINEPLIPYRDDPTIIEEIERHKRTMFANGVSTSSVEKDELKKMIEKRDEQITETVSELRKFLYEINTMLSMSNG